MINNKKVIGLCITKINDNTRSDYVDRLHRLAEKNGYKLLVFNSFVDFYELNSFNRGAASVYKLIDFNLIDVLLIAYDTFVNKSVPDEIINNAHVRGVPVVILNGKKEGCVCIDPDYREALKSIIRHVIKDHSITDTFFIAGKKGDTGSDIRIECYKDVLKENGLPFCDDMIDYGEYWENPTILIVRNYIEKYGKPPQAFICANDYMAFAVCGELKRLGYRVPEDVIVTGFDGVPEAEYFRPKLTTCYENLEEVAQISIDAINTALDNKYDKIFTYSHIPSISESCGCEHLTAADFRNVAADLYQTIHDMEVHEDFEYDWIDKILDIKDMNDLYDTLSGCMLANSFACLNSDFAASVIDSMREKSLKPFSDELIIVSSKYLPTGTDKILPMSLSQLLPTRDIWAEDSSCYILNSIYIGDLVVGYYAVNTSDLMYSKRKMKRVLKTINISFNVAMNYFKQKNMSLRAENYTLINPVTGMPNLKGALKWFDEFSENNRSKTLSISVYGIPKYNYIMENYGNLAIEEAVRFISEALKIANQEDCYLAHISEDEFLVINYYKDPKKIGSVIENSTSVFFRSIDGYNSGNNKEYYVEVNSGCTVVNGDWGGSLESYIKFANSEMYMNRLKYGNGIIMKEKTAAKEHYNVFNILIDKNMFSYHFQPIVSAKTGEILGYEALMRTDVSIGMNPLEVLEVAKKYGRLYEIEKATMFNVIKKYADEQEKFSGRTVFINTIPGFFLNEHDKELLCERYGDIMDRFIFELTEQDTVSDDELNIIRSMSGKKGANQIAIDDYGTGHSNIVNLMRYAPQIIKIDRFLITDIHKNMNKQMFVRSTIDFAKLNGIKVLAEGVETYNEMRAVIDLGVDLIQGYYTGKPAPEPIAEISSDIRREILEANPLFGQDL